LIKPDSYSKTIRFGSPCMYVHDYHNSHYM